MITNDCSWPKADIREYHKRETLSQRPNDRFRLEAAGQIIELRQAENDPLRTFRAVPAVSFHNQAVVIY